ALLGGQLARSGDPAFVNNAADQPGGRDVEGRVVHLHALGRDAASGQVRDLFRSALLNGNRRAVWQGAVERARRGRDIERHVVRRGGQRQGVSADLVGRVAVGGNAVRAGDD